MRWLVFVCVVWAVLAPARQEEAGASAARDRIGELGDLLAQGHFPEAEELARELRARLAGKGSIEEALVDARLVATLYLSSRASSAEAMELAQAAVALAERSAGSADARTGECLFHRGVLHYYRNDFAAARTDLERALSIQEAALGADPAVARTLVYLAELRVDASRASGVGLEEALQESAQLFDRARAIHGASPPGSRGGYACPDERQGVALYNLGRYDEAEALLERGLACYEVSVRPEHPFTGRTLYNLACVARIERDWVVTRDYLERSLAIRRVSDRPNAIYCLRELGAMALEFGDPQGARQWFERGLALEEELPSNRKRGLLLMDLAGLYTSLDGSEALQEAQARADTAVELLASPWEKFDALIVRAELRRQVPDPAGTLADLRAAREVLGEYLDRQRQATLLQSEATLRESSGDLAAADELLRQAIKTLIEDFGPGYGGLEGPLYQLAALEFRRGRFEASVHEALRAEAAFQNEWRRTTRGFEEERLLLLQERFSRALDLALLAAVRDGRAELVTLAWEALVAARSQGFEELRARHEALRRTEDEHVLALQRDLAEARGRLARTYVASRLASSTSSAELEAAREERNAAERRLALALRERPEAQPAPDLATLRAALPEGGALVAFAPLAATAEAVVPGGATPTRSELAAFVLRRDRIEPTVALVLPRAPLEQGIGKLALLAESGSESEFRQAGKELTDTLWKPLARALEGVTLAFIVPAGPIGALDFATLPIGENEYLVEHGPTFHWLGNERELLEAGRAAARGSGLVAVGGIDFGAANQADPLFGALANSTREVHGVEALFHSALPEEPVRRLEAADATEALVCSAAPTGRILHFATHGFALSEPGTRGFGRAAPARESVPLALLARDAPLFSGLALAGANRAAEAREGADGILTAEELSSLALDGVEWVVLSSCKSANGVSRGASSREGLFGLPRALRIAGAHTVIASLFPVEDALVPAWMEELYRARFVQRCDSPTSVRRASLALLAKLRKDGRGTHPRGWGGFLCTGDWR